MKTRKNNLIIIGADSFGEVTLDAALEMNCYQEIYFIDDNKEIGNLIHGTKIIGGMKNLNSLGNDVDYVIAITNNKARKKVAENYNLNYVNIIHPTAFISRFAELGLGNIVLSNSSIDPNVILTNHVIINKNSSIGNNSILKNYSRVSPVCGLGGFSELEEGVFIGLGSTLIPDSKVGNWSIVGAGSVVTKSIPSNVTAVGIPAKIIKK